MLRLRRSIFSYTHHTTHQNVNISKRLAMNKLTLRIPSTIDVALAEQTMSLEDFGTGTNFFKKKDMRIHKYILCNYLL